MADSASLVAPGRQRSCRRVGRAALETGIETQRLDHLRRVHGHVTGGVEGQPNIVGHGHLLEDLVHVVLVADGRQHQGKAGSPPASMASYAWLRSAHEMGVFSPNCSKRCAAIPERLNPAVVGHGQHLASATSVTIASTPSRKSVSPTTWTTAPAACGSSRPAPSIRHPLDAGADQIGQVAGSLRRFELLGVVDSTYGTTLTVTPGCRPCSARPGRGQLRASARCRRSRNRRQRPPGRRRLGGGTQWLAPPRRGRRPRLASARLSARRVAVGAAVGDGIAVGSGVEPPPQAARINKACQAWRRQTNDAISQSPLQSAGRDGRRFPTSRSVLPADLSGERRPG